MPSIWVRANPRQLPQEELDAIRQTAHLTDVDLPKLAYRALIHAGHRYVGELSYVGAKEIRHLRDMDGRLYRILCLALQSYGVTIGERARERVHVPQ